MTIEDIFAKALPDYSPREDMTALVAFCRGFQAAVEELDRRLKGTSMTNLLLRVIVAEQFVEEWRAKT